MNGRLAVYLALRSLRRHPTVAAATVLGIALAMLVIATILIVDANSSESPLPRMQTLDLGPLALDPATGEERQPQVWIERANEAPRAARSLVPTQQGAAREGLSVAAPPPPRGEADYQAMRLAVRLSAVLAFAVGAVIVFYTMRFSVASRARELSLLRCLGEARHNVAGSLIIEVLIMGILGTALGLALALPAALGLLGAGISTTGRTPSAELVIPWLELFAIGNLGVLIALLGVIGPVRWFWRLPVVDILQPRFLTETALRQRQPAGFAWLLPAVLGASWLAVRPFVQSWLSVVQFFLVEAVVVVGVAMLALWWVRPLLRGAIRLVETGLRIVSPLDAQLAGKRMALTSHKLVFTVAAVTLVFALLTALHDITRALKHEIHSWAEAALYPNVFLKRVPSAAPDPQTFARALARHGLLPLRLSHKAGRELPVRLVAAMDINPMRLAQGKPPLSPGGVILSRTLAARFDVTAGDRLVVDTGAVQHRFKVIEVTDEVGYYAYDGQYVDIKSYALFSDGNPLFADNLERTLGDYLVVRKRDGSWVSDDALQALYPYVLDRRGAFQAYWQIREIDRDFLIFDFVLAMTVLLATIGVTNTMLIRVHAREREFAVLRTLGISRAQIVRLLLVEGAVIGTVSALLALVLGHTVGAVSVAFLDRFTLFEYTLVLSSSASLAISGLALLACTLAALYPALVANRVSSAESLHYE